MMQAPTTTWTSKTAKLPKTTSPFSKQHLHFCCISYNLVSIAHLAVISMYWQACTWKPSHCYCSLWKQTTKVIQDLLKMQGREWKSEFVEISIGFVGHGDMFLKDLKVNKSWLWSVKTDFSWQKCVLDIQQKNPNLFVFGSFCWKFSHGFVFNLG